MTFFAQGKTNWKFLLFVIILAAIVGGGIFIYGHQEIIKSRESSRGVIHRNKKHLAKENIEKSAPFTKEDFNNSVSNLLNSDDVEVITKDRANFSGCQMIDSSKEIIKGDKQYSLSESRYPNNLAKEICENQKSIYAMYLETYWIGGKIYSRQGKDQDFKEVPSSSKVVIAPKPLAWWKELFSGLDRAKSFSIKNNGEAIEVDVNAEINAESKGFDRKLTFFIDRKSKEITSISFEVEGTKENLFAKGTATVIRPAPLIKLPSPFK